MKYYFKRLNRIAEKTHICVIWIRIRKIHLPWLFGWANEKSNAYFLKDFDIFIQKLEINEQN